MKKVFTVYVTLIILFKIININAQQVNTEWVINNFTGFPVGVMIGLDDNENILVTGYAGDNTKIITTKYNTNGDIIWERFYSDPDNGVVATWLSIDASGNAIITGYTRTYSSNPIEVGLLTLKYDNNGNLLWDSLIPGTWAFALRSIIDQYGNIYVTGRAWQYTATYDFVTIKYAPDGTQLWFDTFDQNGGFHTPTGMDLDQAGNLFITGGGISGGLLTVMYNSAGVKQWIREEPGTGGHNIKVDNNGGIFITGSFFDNNTGTSDDMMLLKYDLSGNLLWQKYYDFGNSEYGKLINIDSQSNIFITGYGAEPGAYFVGWLTAKFDASGNLLWYNRIKVNQSWEEFPYFALIGPDDELYVTGNVGVPSGGTTYHGLETIRYNSDGSIPWVAEVNLYAGIGKGLALGTDLSLYAVGMFYYSVLKYSQVVVSNQFSLNVKVFLEGPYNVATGFMNTSLNPALIPLSQPYNIAPWNYAGTESVSVLPTADIVDWVLVELRDAAQASMATGSTRIARQAAFLLKNGNIVGLDGSALPLFDVPVVDNLFALVWHRNHAGVLSSGPVTGFNGIYSYDFTNAEGKAYGGVMGHKQMNTGIWGMFSGDGNADGTISLLDKTNEWNADAGKKDYLSSDFDLNSHVSNQDKNDYWQPNDGSGSSVPE